jgi:hypothetical protein
MLVSFQHVVVHRLLKIKRPRVVIFITFFDCFFRDTSKHEVTHAYDARMSAVFCDRGGKVRMLVRTYKLIALTELACHVGAIFLITRCSANPAVLVSGRRRRRIQARRWSPRLAACGFVAGGSPTSCTV